MAISKVTGTPWKPYLYTEANKQLARAPVPALDKPAADEHEEKEKDKAIVPKSFAI